jgi:hypothetical protein
MNSIDKPVSTHEGEEMEATRESGMIYNDTWDIDK